MSEPRTYSAAAKKAEPVPLEEVVEMVNAAEWSWVYPRARRSRRRITGGSATVELRAGDWVIFYVSTDDAGTKHLGSSWRGHGPLFLVEGRVVRPT